MGPCFDFCDTTLIDTKPRRLRPTLPTDTAQWMKQLPEAVARDLGYNAVPAVEAFSRNGLCPEQVANLAQIAGATAIIIVKDCDAIRALLLRRGIQLEYDNMIDDRSVLVDLVGSAITLIQRMLGALDQATLI